MEEIFDEERLNCNHDDLIQRHSSPYITEKQTGAITAEIFALLVSGAMAYMGANPFVDKSKANLQPVRVQENR